METMSGAPTRQSRTRKPLDETALVRIGRDSRSARPAKKDKPVQSPGIRAGITKEARSVVALSHVSR
jgi:hypothetical protein